MCHYNNTYLPTPKTSLLRLLPSLSVVNTESELTFHHSCSMFTHCISLSLSSEIGSLLPSHLPFLFITLFQFWTEFHSSALQLDCVS